METVDRPDSQVLLNNIKSHKVLQTLNNNVCEVT